MKRIFRTLIFLAFITFSFYACRDTNDRADDARMEVKDKGDKVKIKTDDKKIKIKKDDDGTVTKKVKTDD